MPCSPIFDLLHATLRGALGHKGSVAECLHQGCAAAEERERERALALHTFHAPRIEYSSHRGQGLPTYLLLCGQGERSTAVRDSHDAIPVAATPPPNGALLLGGGGPWHERQVRVLLYADADGSGPSKAADILPCHHHAHVNPSSILASRALGDWLTSAAQIRATPIRWGNSGDSATKKGVLVPLA